VEIKNKQERTERQQTYKEQKEIGKTQLKNFRQKDKQRDKINTEIGTNKKKKTRDCPKIWSKCTKRK
jgi:hypothetical protein